jgi:probable HAF family extracellular repeat protein
MNSVPLRRLIQKYGSVGYLLVGLYLAGHWLIRLKRRQTVTALALTLLASSLMLWIAPTLFHAPNGGNLSVAQAYTITDLGIVSGYDYSFGGSVNAKGQTSGFLADKEFEKLHGFFCTSGGKMMDIGTLGGDLSIAVGINDAGQVAGSSLTAKETVMGFVWGNGKLTPVGALGGQNSIAAGINNKGQVVGLAETARGEAHSFLWKDGVIKDISASCPGPFNMVTAINDNSDMTGYFSKDGETVQSFVLSSGKSKVLPTLGGDFTIAVAVGKTQVVGFGTIQKGDEADVHGFVWQSSGIQDVGTLGGQFSFAESVNDSGIVVGGAETKSAGFHAFAWQNGKMIDLNKLLPSGSGWQLFSASGINERGQITGTGLVGKNVHAFLLTPKG